MAKTKRKAQQEAPEQPRETPEDRQAKLAEALAKAKASGRYMVAIWRREDNMVHQDLIREDFFIQDEPLAGELLLKALSK